MKTPDSANPLRVCFCGSRGFSDLEAVKTAVAGLDARSVLVHGGAKGVDTAAAKAAEERGLTVEEFVPDWARYGRGAGPKRNRDMIATCDVVYAFWDGRSRGTMSAIETARSLGKDLILVRRE